LGVNIVNKKIFTILLTAFFVIIAVFHFQFNLNKRSQPPSENWSKEVLVSSGNLIGKPSILKFKDNYIVAHSDGNKIKVIVTDMMAAKINEKTFKVNGVDPLCTTALTDGKNIYVYWSISEGGKRSASYIKLDEKLNLLEESSIPGIYEIVSVGDSMLAINYGDKVELIDLPSGRKYSMQANEAEMLSSTRNSKAHIVSYKEKSGEIKYFLIVDGMPSSVRSAAQLTDVTSIIYVNSALTADDNYAYLLMEYRNKGEYGGTKEIKFPLIGQEKAVIGEFKTDKTRTYISDITPYYEAGSAKFLARTTIPYDKKREYDNIVEYNMTNRGKFIQVSRTKELSMYPTAAEGVVLFCDVVEKDKINVYMASNKKEFIDMHSGQRYSEIKLALIDTIGGILFSFVYIIPYGSIWVIPIIGIVSIYSVMEFKLPSKKKKAYFGVIYLSFFIFKCLGIRFVSFKRFGYYMPEFMTFPLSVLISIVISLVCGIYAYSKYSKGMESDMGATALFMPVVYDTILTLMVFVPFIV
jgi:hypothetical protein